MDLSSPFWTSVAQGIALLGRWQLWAGALAAAAIPLGVLLGLAAVARRADSPALGCLTLLLGAFLRAACTALYIALVLPIVMGGSDATTPLAAIAANAGTVLRATGMAALIALLVGAVPLVPGALKSVFSSFAQGVAVARVLLESPLRAAMGLPAITLRLLPAGLLLGYLAVALLLALLIAAPTWLLARTKRRTPVVQDPAPEPGTRSRRRPAPPPTAAEWITGAVAVVAGYLPLFMYLRYVVLTGVR